MGRLIQMSFQPHAVASPRDVGMWRPWSWLFRKPMKTDGNRVNIQYIYTYVCIYIYIICTPSVSIYIYLPICTCCVIIYTIIFRFNIIMHSHHEISLTHFGQAGGSCSIGCKPPFFGPSSLASCPAGNTDPTTPLEFDLTPPQGHQGYGGITGFLHGRNMSK